MPGVQCGICFEENIKEIGELDACCHRFCYDCIMRWSEQENRCPFCKQRFAAVGRKRLRASDEAAVTADGVGDGRSQLKRLRGEVLETHRIQDRQQGWQPEDLMDLDLDGLVCGVCGSGDNDESLLICDGCDGGFHTYCVGLDAIPELEWFCPTCHSQREAALAAALGGTNSGRNTRRRAQQQQADSTRAQGVRTALRMPSQPAAAATTPRRTNRRTTRSAALLHQQQHADQDVANIDPVGSSDQSSGPRSSSEEDGGSESPSGGVNAAEAYSGLPGRARRQAARARPARHSDMAASTLATAAAVVRQPPHGAAAASSRGRQPRTRSAGCASSVRVTSATPAAAAAAAVPPAHCPSQLNSTASMHDVRRAAAATGLSAGHLDGGVEEGQRVPLAARRTVAAARVAQREYSCAAPSQMHSVRADTPQQDQEQVNFPRDNWHEPQRFNQAFGQNASGTVQGGGGGRTVSGSGSVIQVQQGAVDPATATADVAGTGADEVAMAWFAAADARQLRQQQVDRQEVGGCSALSPAGRSGRGGRVGGGAGYGTAVREAPVAVAATTSPSSGRQRVSRRLLAQPSHTGGSADGEGDDHDPVAGSAAAAGFDVGGSTLNEGAGAVLHRRSVYAARHSSAAGATTSHQKPQPHTAEAQHRAAHALRMSRSTGVGRTAGDLGEQAVGTGASPISEDVAAGGIQSDMMERHHSNGSAPPPRFRRHGGGTAFVASTGDGTACLPPTVASHEPGAATARTRGAGGAGGTGARCSAVTAVPPGSPDGEVSPIAGNHNVLGGALPSPFACPPAVPASSGIQPACRLGTSNAVPAAPSTAPSPPNASGHNLRGRAGNVSFRHHREVEESPGQPVPPAHHSPEPGSPAAWQPGTSQVCSQPIKTVSSDQLLEGQVEGRLQEGQLEPSPSRMQPPPLPPPRRRNHHNNVGPALMPSLPFDAFLAAPMLSTAPAFMPADVADVSAAAGGGWDEPSGSVVVQVVQPEASAASSHGASYKTGGSNLSMLANVTAVAPMARVRQQQQEVSSPAVVGRTLLGESALGVAGQGDGGGTPLDGDSYSLLELQQRQQQQVQRRRREDVTAAAVADGVGGVATAQEASTSQLAPQCSGAIPEGLDVLANSQACSTLKDEHRPSLSGVVLQGASHTRGGAGAGSSGHQGRVRNSGRHSVTATPTAAGGTQRQQQQQQLRPSLASPVSHLAAEGSQGGGAAEPMCDESSWGNATPAIRLGSASE